MITIFLNILPFENTAHSFEENYFSLKNFMRRKRRKKERKGK
jgi:hypothetical protein